MAFRISYAVARQIADAAAAESPNEACGLLAGRGDTISRAISLRNAAPDPSSHFAFEPNEQLSKVKAIDAAGLDWIGVYHSHPRTAPIPSETDVAAALDPKLLHLIVSLKDAKPAMTLWRIDTDRVSPIDLVFDTVVTFDEDRTLTRGQRIAVIVAGIASLLLLLFTSVMLLPPAPEITPLP